MKPSIFVLLGKISMQCIILAWVLPGFPVATDNARSVPRVFGVR
jgi:hypothetical protein